MVKKSTESSTTSAASGASSINPIEVTWERKETPPRRSPYDRVRVTLDTGDEGLTQQADKDRTDINNIVNHFATTGEFPFSAVRKQEPQYGDVSEISNMYMDEAIQKQQEAIERLTELENDLAESKQPGLAEHVANLVETLQHDAESQPESSPGDSLE